MKNNSNGGTIILKCTCESEDQDKMYGKGMRVHNKSQTKDLAYCTVCCTRSNNKQSKDVLASENKFVGVTFDTKAPKSRSGKPIPKS